MQWKKTRESWTERKEQKRKERRQNLKKKIKKGKLHYGKTLPLWNKVRAFFLETVPHKIHKMSIPEGLLLNCWHWPICFFYLNHRRGETQKQSSGPGLWYIVLLWEKATRRLERNVMSFVPRDAVLCSVVMVTARMMRRIEVRWQQP